MHISFRPASVTISMTREESVRLGVAVMAGYETLTRAEYFIRTGLSEAVMREVFLLLTSDESAADEAFDLRAGVERDENPYHQRPTTS